MSPAIHLIGSWLVAAVVTDNSRDRKLVTWAGVLPDADGLGMLVDSVKSAISGNEDNFYYYHKYHHMLLHGWPGAVVVSLLFACFARKSRMFYFGVFSHSICIWCAIWLVRAGQMPVTFGRFIIRNHFSVIQYFFGTGNGNWMAGKTKQFISFYY